MSDMYKACLNTKLCSYKHSKYLCY